MSHLTSRLRGISRKVAHNRTGAVQGSLAIMREMAALMQRQTDQGRHGQNKKMENVGSLAHVILWPISGNRPVALKTTGVLVDSPPFERHIYLCRSTNSKSV
jgi:hypothetical protein